MQTADAGLNEGEMDAECLLVSDATPAVPPLPLGSKPLAFCLVFLAQDGGCPP